MHQKCLGNDPKLPGKRLKTDLFPLQTRAFSHILPPKKQSFPQNPLRKSKKVLPLQPATNEFGLH